MKKLFSIFIAIVLIAPVLAPTSAFAESDNNLSTYTLLEPIDDAEAEFDATADDALSKYLNTWFTRIISLAAVYAVMVLIIYGFQYSFSETIFKKVTARERVVPAVGGLILLLLSVILLQTIDSDLTNISGFKKITVEGGSSFGFVDREDEVNKLNAIRNSICFDDMGGDLWARRMGCGDSAYNDVFNENSDIVKRTRAASERCYQATVHYCKLSNDLARDREDNKNAVNRRIAANRSKVACGTEFPCDTITEDSSNGDLLKRDSGLIRTGNIVACQNPEDGCVVAKTIVDNLSKIDPKPVITEAYPPTVYHEHQCHYVATCVDASVRGKSPSEVADFFDQMVTNQEDAVYPVLEFGTPGERTNFLNSLDDEQRTRLEGKTIVVPGVTPHFSVYTSKGDANGSGGLNSKGVGY